MKSQSIHCPFQVSSTSPVLSHYNGLTSVPLSVAHTQAKQYTLYMIGYREEEGNLRRPKEFELLWGDQLKVQISLCRSK